MTQTRLPAAGREADTLDPALIRLAGVLIVGVAVVQLDTTIVAVAINTLGRSFRVGISTIQWVSTAYLLALAMVIPLAGWSVERFGAKRMWLLSLAFFLAGSALCGAAWSAGSLIAFRVVQGAGGGLLLPLMQTILAQAAGPRRMGRMMSAVAVPTLLTPILGPVIGGLILDNLNWRWIFFINVPVCLAAILLARRGMPDVRTPGRHPLDARGLALLSPALATVVYGLSEAGSQGSFDNARVIVPVVIGVALLAAFIYHALLTTTIEPLIDLRMFRARAFAASAGMMFLIGISAFGAMFLLPLYEQQARGRGAVHTGLLLAPQGLGMMIAVVVVGRLTDRGAVRTMIFIGLLLSALGTITYTQIDPDTSEWLLGTSLTVRGVGLATATVPVMSAAYHGLRRDEIPRATTAMRIFLQTGGSVGTAVLAVILSQQITHRGGAARIGTAGLADAFGTTFWWTLGFTLLAIPFAFLVPGRTPAAPPKGGGTSMTLRLECKSGTR